MELRQLRYFVRVVDAGSISRAAESLFVSQPALSLQINQLEEELGVRLFVRSSRGVEPTEHGLSLSRQARIVIAHAEALLLLAKQQDRGPAGMVTVGLPGTVCSILGLSLLKNVAHDLPGVQLKVVEGPSWYLSELVAKGQIDLAILFDAKSRKGLQLIPVINEPLLFVGRKNTLRGFKEINVATAATFPLVLFSRPNGIREALEEAWREQNISPLLVAEINSPNLLLEAVEAGIGFSMLPMSRVASRVSANALDAITFSAGSCKRVVSFGSSIERGLSPATLAIRRTLCSLVQQSIESDVWPGCTLDQDALALLQAS